MHNVYLFQPNFEYGPGAIKEYYLPYSVGLLWSYVQQFDDIKNNFQLQEIFFRRERISEVIKRINNPKIVAFSCYLWNWEYNKKLAKLVKKTYPDCIILFGGPQVTDRPFQTLFFQNHKYVDVIINGEGELSFHKVLADILENHPLQRVYTQARINELDIIPSPYLTGVFDQIIKDNPEFGWHGTLETNRGCPYACTFCDWGTTTYSKVKKFDISRVIQEIKWMSDHKIEYMVVADANFGIFADRDREIAIELARIKEHTGYPKVVGITWQKNSQIESADLAKLLGSRGFTLSVQSLDLDVLTAIKRKNMKINDLEEILTYCEKEDIPTYTELILGLPHETTESWKNGHTKLMSHGQHNMIDVFLVSILENSEISQQIEKYGIGAVKVSDYLLGGIDESTDELDVTEFCFLVNQTNSMLFNEFIDSYMYSWLVISFHYLGYTQLVSRFLHANNNITYRQFYDQLFEYAKNSTGLINSAYRVTRGHVSEYMSSGTFTSTEKYSAGTMLVWEGARVFPRQIDTIQQELKDFLDLNFCHLIDDSALYKELINFQIHFTVDYHKTYPYNITVPSTIYNKIFDRSYKTNTVDLTLSNRIVATDIDDFCTRLWTTRRSGASRVSITPININVDNNAEMLYY